MPVCIRSSARRIFGGFSDMKSSTPSRKSPQNSSEGGRCRLLELPLELQLQIYELVVFESTPMLLNMPCNSSFRKRYRLLDVQEKSWASGKSHPPLQPAITRTCRAIRVEALPLFYSENVFRACYCSPSAMLPPVIRWLQMIGRENRERLRHFYLYDRNERQDTAPFVEEALTEAEKCDIFTKLQGRMETMSGKDCCCHLVAFGEWTRRDRQMPLALEPGVPRLRLDGEE